MVFSKTQWKGNFIFQYEGKDLEIVLEFKYLDVIFNYKGSFVKNKKNTCMSRLKEPCLVC